MNCLGLGSAIHNHPFGWLMAALYVVTASVANLPQPGSPEPFRVLFYKWAFDTVHTLLNQVDKIVASKGIKLPSVDPIAVPPQPPPESIVIPSKGIK